MKILFPLTLLVFLTACTTLPTSPEELSAANRMPAVKTQEAILPNTSYDMMFSRMKAYASACLNFTRTIPCSGNCKPTKIRFTPTIITDKNRLTMYLQKKGGAISSKRLHKDGFYLMSVHALTNGSSQQLIIHGVDTSQHGFTTQATMDWLAGKKNLCPKL